MASVRPHKGGFVVDYYDFTGRRRWKSFAAIQDAEDYKATVERVHAQGLAPGVEFTADSKLADYAAEWLRRTRHDLRPGTHTTYEKDLRNHVLPRTGSDGVPGLGEMKLGDLRRARIKAFLLAKMDTGLSADSVRNIHAVLRSMLSSAVDEEIIPQNPGARLGRGVYARQVRTHRQESVSAMTEEELARFLAAARAKDPWHYPLFLCLARTGARTREVYGLRWAKIGFEQREILIDDQLGEVVGGVPKEPFPPPKTKRRTIDASTQLCKVLRRLRIERREQTLRHAWGRVPELVFVTPRGTPHDDSNVRKVFLRVLEAAGIPKRNLSPRSFRHTCATLLAHKGASPKYVRDHLGHHSITTTMDVYGSSFRMIDKEAIDLLDTGAEQLVLVDEH